MAKIGVSYNTIEKLDPITEDFDGTELLTVFEGEFEGRITFLELQKQMKKGPTFIFRRIDKDFTIGNEEVALQRDSILELGVTITIEDGGELLLL